MKRLFVLLLCLLQFATAQYLVETVSIGGKQVQGIDYQGVRFVRAEFLAPYLLVGTTSQTVRVSYGQKQVVFPLERNPAVALYQQYYLQVNGQTVIGRPAMVVNSGVFVPLEQVSAALGLNLTSSGLQIPQANVKNVASKTDPEYDRVVLEIDQNVVVQDLSNSKTIKLVIQNATAKATTYTTTGKYIPRLKVDTTGQNVTIELPLPKNVGYHHYFTPLSDRNARLVLDVGKPFQVKRTALQERVVKPVIVLDAGHGGADTGGTRGVVEKELVLEVVRRMGEALSKAGWQVKYTRTTDVQVPLATRALLARSSDAFVSVHLGYAPSGKQNGVMLYYQSGAEQLEYIRQARGEADPGLGVSSNQALKQFGETVKKELSRVKVPATVLPTRELYLLSEAPKAALMVELGFPENKEDLARLKDPTYLDSVALALARGISVYLTPRDQKVETTAKTPVPKDPLQKDPVQKDPKP